MGLVVKKIKANNESIRSNEEMGSGVRNETGMGQRKTKLGQCKGLNVGQIKDDVWISLGSW